MSPTGAAGRDGRLRVGLRLLEVNQQSLLGLTHAEAVQLLRSVGDTLTVLVCDGFDTSTTPALEVSCLPWGLGAVLALTFIVSSLSASVWEVLSLWEWWVLCFIGPFLVTVLEAVVWAGRQYRGGCVCPCVIGS